MNDEYKIKVNYGVLKYETTDCASEILHDVDTVCSPGEVQNVSNWMKTAKENDEYESSDGRVHIWHWGYFI